jgi:alanyl-tRNA synthetase
MSTRTAAELRSAFLGFFARNGHEVVQSGPVVPPNDPTLMFANAGMVQFKDLFTGREKRAYKRATTSQKCIRISGKHNDLEAVGPSPRHHTFFEMLGNFSFGDYFKEEAIVFAWDFLTKELDLPKDRLVMSYFKGEEGIPEDTFARDLWKKLTGFGDAQVRGLGMADNFWAMGDTGPCGPCSEIYFFNGDGVDPALFGQEQTPEGVGYCEIWNLVFMQFERSLKDGVAKLDPLPAPSIDTGGGLERMCVAAQGKLSNYDTDLLRSLVEQASEISRKKYGATMAPDDVSMRVIADHARTTAIMIADGVMPDRTGREYVLRRVMRRAIRHGHRLGIEKPFLHQVTSSVIELMGAQYPELRERQDLIASVVEAEEVRFRQTIERGLNLLEDRFAVMAKSAQTTLPGADAFQLYDTYGFPLDLTEVICTERGFAVDQKGYDAALEEARKRSEFGGMDQAVEGVYREALGKWDHPAIHYNMALALLNLDQPVETYEHFVSALKYGQEPLDSDKFDQANRYKSLLEKQLAGVDIRCNMEGATVKLDGKVLYYDAWDYAFEFEHPGFRLRPAGCRETAEAVARREHAMARDDQGDGVVRHRLAHVACRFGASAERLGEEVGLILDRTAQKGAGVELDRVPVDLVIGEQRALARLLPSLEPRPQRELHEEAA